MAAIYKLLAAEKWREAQATGRFDGSAVDRADGFIHFSAADQLAETARRHFQGRSDLICLEVEAEALGEALKWEPARDGALFPHLYGALPTWAVTCAWAVELGVDGVLNLGLDQA